MNLSKMIKRIAGSPAIEVPIVPNEAKNEGCLDGLHDGTICGWLTNKNGEPCFYEVFVNGKLITQGFANLYRDDLGSEIHGGNIGFSCSVEKLIEEEELFFSDSLQILIRADHNRIINNSLVIENNLAEYLSHYRIGDIPIRGIVSVIRDSGLWDDSFYISRYLPSNFKGDPLLHFILFGWKKGYKPSPYFSQTYYNIHNHDVVKTGILPLYHYIVIGENEGRNPNDYFDAKDYLEANPDLENIDGTLLAHYSNSGMYEGRLLRKKVELLPTVTGRVVAEINYTDLGYISSFELAENNFYEGSLLTTTNEINTKVIAYYLPQFHPIEQNDKWWGKSFTEWTNVTKAKPLLKNHEHPRLPSDLGFYDLRLKENIVEQAKMATSAGVDAFCFYYYWFNSTVLMETPIEIIYQNKDIDIEYCICWANENWTKTWDGLDKEVLIEQTYSPEDDLAFIKHVSKYFKDTRYVMIDNKPLLIIYRPSIFPDMKATIKRWRKWARDNSLGELHITMVQFDDADPTKYGFDAALEFPPHKVASENVASHMNFKEGFVGSVHDYSGMVSNALNKIDKGFPCYKSVTMAWDNTARRNDRASLFTNVTSGKLHRWLSGIENMYAKNEVEDKHKLIFVNAWNEWAEGTYLEPDRDHGYSYLNAVSNFKSGIIKVPKVALLVHVYYSDLVEEIISYAKNIDVEFDILITCVQDAYQAVSKRFNEEFPNCLVDIKVVPNKGRDIAPFLCNHIENYFRYDYICKIHSKKSVHAGGINNWRNFLFDRLLGSQEQVNDILAKFENDENLGIQFPEYSEAIKPFIEWGSNKVICQELMGTLGLECPEKLPDFPAGSMFWFRPKALDILLKQNWKIQDFPYENGQIDETIMHAVERCLILISQSTKFGYCKIKDDI
jgi:lipopolysaccharide biosynthesis protein